MTTTRKRYQIVKSDIEDNQRALHGRTAFNAETPARSVLTSSVDLEDFHSTMRILQKTLGIDSPPVLFNQGMVV